MFDWSVSSQLLDLIGQREERVELRDLRELFNRGSLRLCG